MVFSWTRTKPIYGSKTPLRLKGHHDVWSCLHERTLHLGCLPEDNYIFEAENQVEQVPPFACSFSKLTNSSHLLAVVDEDGFVTLVDTSQTAKVVKVFRAHRNAVFDLAWADGKNHLVTASGDQMAALWDVVVGKALGVFMGHSCSLKSVCFRPGDCHVFATGARDGNILIWDTRCNNRGGSQVPHHTAVNIIKEAHAKVAKLRNAPTRKRSRLSPSMPVRGNSLSSVTVVNFQDDMSLFSAGATDSTIKVWDLRKYNKGMKRAPSPRQVYPYVGSKNKNGGFSSLVFNSTRSEFFASCMDDVIYRHSTLGLQTQPIATYYGHQNSSFYVKSSLSRDDGLLLSGSGDGKAYIWNVHQPLCPPVTLCGHEDEVTMVAWAKDDFPKLVTGADDASVRIWRLQKHEDSLPASQTQGRLIGHAERSTINNRMKENLPPVKNAEPSTGCLTPPRQNRTISTEQEIKPTSVSSSPVTPKTPARRHSSISDWLKNSPQTNKKDNTSSPSVKYSHPAPESETLSSTSQKTQEENHSAPELCVTLDSRNTRNVGTNKSILALGQVAEENRAGSKDCFPSVNNNILNKSEHFSGTVLDVNNSRSQRTSAILVEASLFSNTVTDREKYTEAIVESDGKTRKESVASMKQQPHPKKQSVHISPDRTLNSVTSVLETMDSSTKQSPLTGLKRKRKDSTENHGKKSLNSKFVSKEDGSSPRCRKRGHDSGAPKVRKARTIGRGRESLTSHAQHQLCTCSCSGNHRHPTGNLTSSNSAAAENDVSGQTVGVSNSPEGTGLGRESPKTTDGSSSTRNICFYFRPHAREVRRSYSDSATMITESTVSHEQVNKC